ncbi:MAG: pentapeptide repeat-containing protein, partial [Egibacteraceae bacterium]
MSRSSRYEGRCFDETDFRGRRLHDEVYVRYTLRGAAMDELTTCGCPFDGCDFTAAQLAASDHQTTAFTNCRFAMANLATVRFAGCKLTGSDLAGTRLLGLTVAGGDWTWVNLRAVELSKRDLRGLRLCGADLVENGTCAGCGCAAPTSSRTGPARA